MYPVNLIVKDRSCAVIGGGRVAARKVHSLLASEARVTVIAPELVPVLAREAADKRFVWRSSAYVPGMLQGFFLVICASDDAEANHLAAVEAHAAGALVNAAAEPAQSDFFVPSKVEHGDFLLTVSTGGQSPAFTRLLCQELEKSYGEVYGEWLECLGHLRAEVKGRLPDSRQRQAFWRHVLDEHILALVRQHKLEEAEAEIRNAIGRVAPGVGVDILVCTTDEIMNPPIGSALYYGVREGRTVYAMEG